MKTQCTGEALEFHALRRRLVTGRFDGGRISSDAGGVLLREVDKRKRCGLPTFLVARLCQDFGQRVQYSVFECQVDPAQWAALRARLMDEIDERTDSLRFYRLGANRRSRVEHVGNKAAYDPDGPLVF